MPVKVGIVRFDWLGGGQAGFQVRLGVDPVGSNACVLLLKIAVIACRSLLEA